MEQTDKRKMFWLYAYPAVIMAVSMLLVFIIGGLLKNLGTGQLLFGLSIFLFFPLCFFTHGLLLKRMNGKIIFATIIDCLAYMLVLFAGWRIFDVIYMTFYAMIELAGYFFYYMYDLVMEKMNQN